MALVSNYIQLYLICTNADSNYAEIIITAVIITLGVLIAAFAAVVVPFIVIAVKFKRKEKPGTYRIMVMFMTSMQIHACSGFSYYNAMNS